jgi:hypothetical protein
MCTNCSDPLVTFAREYKYNLVKIPRGKIHPLDVLLLYPNSGLKRYCPLPKMVFPNLNPNGGRAVPPAPDLVEDIAADFSGKFSGKMSFDVGLTFLESVLKMLGAGSAGLGLTMSSAKQLQFQFKNVKVESVELYDLSNYMLGIVPDISVNYLSMNEKGEAFVITDVLRSNSIDVKAFDQSGKELRLNIDAIKGIVGPKISVGREVANDLQVSFKGDVDLTFAFKAAAFWIEVPRDEVPGGGIPRGRKYPIFKLDYDVAPPFDRMLCYFGADLEAKNELTGVLFSDPFVEVDDENIENMRDAVSMAKMS